MKYIIAITLLLQSAAAQCQQILQPGKLVVDKNFIQNEQYRSGWYMLKDTQRIEIGTINTISKIEGKKLTIITQVIRPRDASVWIDSTVALLQDFTPVYHSSYNAGRNMVLHFGKTVTGYYKDNRKDSTTVVNDKTTAGYFDSNLYPVLIRWLPYTEGYSVQLSIYDFNPQGKTGVITATVKDARKGTFQTQKSGLRNVWIVTVTDELGAPGGENKYYIDEADRRLWKQEISAGGRKLLLELKED